MKNLKLNDPKNKPHYRLMELVQEVNKRVKNMRFEYDGGTRVECYKEWEHVGELGYAFYSRAGDNLFHVKSDKYIENGKSPYRCKQSKHMRQIVKECVRVFKNTESSEIARKIEVETESLASNVFSGHGYGIRYDKWIPKIYVDTNAFERALLENCVRS